MKNTRILIASAFLFLLGTGLLFAADDILGLWKQLSDKTGKPESIVYLYAYQGRIYGRIIAAYDDKTFTIKDTLLTQKDKADKLAGDPPFCGLDFVYNLEDKGKDYRGLIMDPTSADEYDCRVWKDGAKLVVRGQLKGLGFLGRNQTWLSAAPSDLPANFPLPDPATFVPVVPKKKK